MANETVELVQLLKPLASVPNKLSVVVRRKDGFKMSELGHGVRIEKGTCITVVPWSNIVSYSLTSCDDKKEVAATPARASKSAA